MRRSFSREPGTENCRFTGPDGSVSLLDLTPYGRQETWENSPKGWPQTPAYDWMRRGDAYGAEAARCCR